LDAKVGLYNMSLATFTPTAPPTPADWATLTAPLGTSSGEANTLAGLVPSSRKMNALTVGAGSGTTTFSGNLTLIGSTPLTLTQGAIDMGGNDLIFQNGGYAGTNSGANAWVQNGRIQLNTVASGNRTFPFKATGATGALVLNTGAGTGLGGSDITQVRASVTAAPTGVAAASTTFTGSVATTNLTVTAGSGIVPGMTMSGTGVTAGTVIRSQTSGTPGGAGVYVVSVSQTVASTTITGSAVNMTGTRGYQVDVITGTRFGSATTFHTATVGYDVTDNLISNAQSVVLCQSITDISSGWAVRGQANAAGTLTATGTRASTTSTITTVTGSISGTTLTLTASSTTMLAGVRLFGTGLAEGTQIVSGSGTTYTVSPSQTVAAGTVMTPMVQAPIQFASTMYFGIGKSAGFTTPAPLSYSVTRTEANAYNSIMPTALGGDNTGATYTSSPGWVSVSNDDAISNIVTIPSSTFTYQGNVVTGFRASTNGNMQLQTAAAAPNSSTFTNQLNTQNNVLAVFWEDLTTNPNSGGTATLDNCMRYKIGSGTAGTRQIIAEWYKMTQFGNAGPELYFQIILDENDNSITYNYGNMQMFNGTVNLRYTYSMGMNGGFISPFPQQGEVFANQYENTTAFSQYNVMNSAIAANALSMSPAPRSSYKFTPGTYVAPSPFDPVVSAPTNDNVAGAINVTPLLAFPSNIAWNTTEVPNRSNYYTLRAATQSPQAICGGPANAKDVWFKFTANDPNTQIRVYPSGGMTPAIEVLNSSLTALVPASCNVGTVEGSSALTTSLVGLTVGSEYFVRVYNAKTGTTAQFGALVAGGVIVTPLVISGGTNYPALTTAPGPLMRVTGGGGNGATFNVTNTGGVLSLSLSNGGQGYTSSPTITVDSPDWGYTGEFGLIVFAKAANDDPDLSVAGLGARLIRSQGTCVPPVTLNGVSLTNGSTTITFDSNPSLTVGSVYVISGSGLVPYNVTGTVTSATSMTLASAATGTVTGLTLTGALNNYLNQATNTASGNASYVTCGGNADDDVWYYFRAQNGFTGARVEVQGVGGFNPHVEIWNGSATGTGLTSVAGTCTNATGADGLEAFNFATTPLQYYFIRVYHSGAGTPIGSSFNICLRPACTSAATAGASGESVTPSTLSCEGGSPVTLSFGSGVSAQAAGIVYTWQSSLNGTTWTTLSTSDVPSYTTPSNISNTTQFRGIVSCSNETPTVQFDTTNTILTATAPYPLSLSQGVNLCNGAPTAISVTDGATGPNPYTSFEWTAPAGVSLFEDAAGTTPYDTLTSPTNLSTIYAVSSTLGALPAGLSVTASDIVADPACFGSASASGTVLALPLAPAIAASATSICSGNSVDLSVQAAASYCVPSSASPTYGIDNFSTTGAVVNITNNATGIATGGYINYTATLNCTQAVNGTVSYNVETTAGDDGMAIWVDWNQDGDFADAGEKVANTTGYSAALTGSFTVPATALNGTTRMRVMSDYLSSNPNNPCAAGSAYREVEDYSFTVTGGVVQQYAWSNILATTPSVSTGAITTFPATYTARLNNGTCLSLPSNAITINQAGIPTASIGLVQGVPQAYASVTVSFTGDEDINQVYLYADTDGDGDAEPGQETGPAATGATFVNLTADASLNGTIGTATGTADFYSNFTAFGPYTIDATKVQKLVVNSNNTIYTKQNGAWIDWNQDGDFADAGECIFVTTAGTGAVSSLAGPYAFGIQSGANWVFSVPAGAKNGSTRMRLVVSETSGLTATPPTSVSWGEWEDYTVNVINAPVVEPCPGATLPLTSNVANGGEPYTYTWSLISGGGTGTLSSTSAANPTITPTLDFVVRVDITDNCGSTTFSEVPIGVFDSPIVITPASISVCGNPGTTFTASGGSNTNYTWTPTDGAGALNTTTGDTVVATPTATVTYTATGSYGAGCTGTAQATLNYITPPAITITNAEQPNNIYCGVASNTSTITASSAGTYTYTWTNGTGNSAADNLVQVSNGIVSATADNSYTLTLGAVEVGGLGCVLNQPFTVATYPLPSTNMSATPAVIGLGSTSSLASGVAAGNFSCARAPSAKLPPCADICSGLIAASSKSSRLCPTKRRRR